MTATAAPAAQMIWSTMPGWGIAADLTPPEVINSRELNLLRKLIGAGLAALLVACAGGYVLAARQHSSASRALDQVQARTVQLEAATRTFAGVTRIEGSVTQVQTQIAQLMGSDVDLIKLMGSIRSSLPTPMTITTETVTLNATATAATPGATSGLDTSGLARIGNVTVAGTATTLDNLSTYVDHLTDLPGVVSVVPTSNVRGAQGVNFSLTLGLTAQRISHRFDVTTPGHK